MAGLLDLIGGQQRADSGDSGEAPETYSARRRLALAMLQAGQSEAPIGHWTQGLNRALQSTIGAYRLRSIDDEEKAAQKEANALLLRAMLGGGQGGSSLPASMEQGFDTSSPSAPMPVAPRQAPAPAPVTAAPTTPPAPPPAAAPAAPTPAAPVAPPAPAAPVGSFMSEFAARFDPNQEAAIEPSRGTGVGMALGLPTGAERVADEAPEARNRETIAYKTSLPGEFREGQPIRRGGLSSIPARITQAESGGDPNATNPRSSALGRGQFLKGTWIELIRRLKPELAKGKTNAEILELRRDSGLSDEMTQAYSAEIGQFLGARGFEASPGNVYLGYFLGPAGATRALRADPSTPMLQIDPRAVLANPFLARMTAGDAIKWAAGKMGGGGGGQELSPVERPMRPPAATPWQTETVDMAAPWRPSLEDVPPPAVAPFQTSVVDMPPAAPDNALSSVMQSAGRVNGAPAAPVAATPTTPAGAPPSPEPPAPPPPPAPPVAPAAEPPAVAPAAPTPAAPAIPAGVPDSVRQRIELLMSNPRTAPLGRAMAQKIMEQEITPQRTGDITEYNLAKSQGYKGTFLQYKQEIASTAVKPPQGFRYRTDEMGNSILEPIPGGPRDPAFKGGDLPAEVGARIGLADSFLAKREKLTKEINAFTAADRLNLAAGRGEVMNTWRDIESGLDALRRSLTGAGMSVSEANNYVQRYQISATDRTETMLNKLDGLIDDLDASKRGAIEGKTGLTALQYMRGFRGGGNAPPPTAAPAPAAPGAAVGRPRITDDKGNVMELDETGTKWVSVAPAGAR